MSRDFRNESEAHEFIGFTLRAYGRVHLRKRVPGLKLPDIDVLLESNELVGYEVKYFPTQGAAKPHEGVGEALSLLLYGLDKTYLVHVFDLELRSKAEDIASQTAKLVRSLPIGYLCYLGRTEKILIKEAEANPFLNDPQVRDTREKLLKMLRGVELQR